MGLWPVWINQLLTKKFWSAVRKEGFLTTYQRLHRANRSNQTKLGVLENVPSVGRDEFGNRYYEDLNASYGNRIRWVEYSDYFRTTGQYGDHVPPRWDGWLSQQYDERPSLTREDVFVNHFYQQPHVYDQSFQVTRYNPKDAVFREEKTDFLKARMERKAKSWSPTINSRS